MTRGILALLMAITTGQASAQDPGPGAICLMIEAAARANGLPPEFFARLIWRESRFRSDAIGPRTSRGDRAEGIAQFMPGTASERALLDPFDPIQALPKAAEFLRELRGRFGNLGLAAAAYNAGPRRVRDWLNGAGAMPSETRQYVVAITGRTVEDWSRSRDDIGRIAPFDCGNVVALLRQEPAPYVTALEQRIRASAARPWGVQLAAGFSRDQALSAYGRAVTRFRLLLDQHDPVISSAIFRSRGTRPFYQVRVGTETRSEAESLCQRLRRTGGSCLVLRQSPPGRAADRS